MHHPGKTLIIAGLSLLATALLSSCASIRPPATLTYTNPVWDGYLADPQVLFTQGMYYAYGTGEADGKQFPILKSRDFATWEPAGGALVPPAGLKLTEYWAPEVVERNGKFYLYYAGNRRMRVATATSPAGPFTDAGIDLFPDLEFSIDGHPFRDPASGKWHLFFARDFFDPRPGTALSVVELGNDMISTHGPMHTVLRAFADWQIYERNRPLYGKTWPAWHTVEGPTVIYRDGRYHCFYSGGNWQTPGYGVGCAVSASITGPYVDNWSREKASVLSTIPGKLIGPGHNGVILGPDHQTYFIVYHSWNPQQTARQMCIDPLAWTGQGPKCVMPSRGEKTIRLPVTAMPETGGTPASSSAWSTFVNPVYEGADPFVVHHTDGFYYFCQSEGDQGIAVWKSPRLTDKGIKKVVWRPSPPGWNSSEIWAPELHYLNGKWFIYYAADDGNNLNHRTGVLEARTADPQGEYIDRGTVFTGDGAATGENNRWSIDATPLEMGGKLYLVWSGFEKAGEDNQSLYIAEMATPWSAEGPRVKIAANNTYDWEKVAEDPRQKGLHEGPQILKHQGRVYLIYSCSGSWEPTYKLGQLSIAEKADPLVPTNWIKKPVPVFTGSATVHGVGHASFTTSPDGKENWIVYHSKINARPGWQRNVRIQPFTWDKDGSPSFGIALNAGIPLPLPSGEQPPVRGTAFTDRFDDDAWDRWHYFGYNRFIDAMDQKLILGFKHTQGMANHYRSGEKAIIRDQVWDDFSFQAKVRVVEGKRDAGLIFRVSHPAVGYDAMKGYFAGIIPGTRKVILGKMDGVGWQELALVDYPVRENISYQLKVVARQDLIQVFVDGKLAIEARDATYASGFAGVRVIDSMAAFDDVEIKQEK